MFSVYGYDSVGLVLCFQFMVILMIQLVWFMPSVYGYTNNSVGGLNETCENSQRLPGTVSAW